MLSDDDIEGHVAKMLEQVYQHSIDEKNHHLMQVQAQNETNIGGLKHLPTISQ